MIGAFALNDASRFPRYALRYVTLETIEPLIHDPQVGLAALAAGHTTSIPLLMAGSLVSAAPAMIVYLIFQRFLVRGLTMGIDR